MQQLAGLLLAHGFNLKQQGEEYISNCIHCSAENSMSIYLHEEKWIASCHECGSRNTEEEVTLFLADKEKPRKKGIVTEETLIEKEARWKHSIPDTIPDMASKMYGSPLKFWTYRNPDGKIIGYIAKYAEAILPWSFGTYSKNVTPKWKINYLSIPRPLYNLDKLSNTKGYVAIVKSEQTADDASKLLPMPCTTWQGQESNIRNVDLTPLQGRKVVILFNSFYGENRHITWLAKYLLEVIKADSVSVIDSSDKPIGWNLSNALAEGWDMEKTTSWMEANELGATVERACMEKSKPALSIVPDLETTSVEIKTQKQVGNNIANIVTRLELNPLLAEEFSEAALTAIWNESVGKEWKYTTEWGKWFYFDGAAWREDRLNKVTYYCKNKMIEVVNWPNAAHLQRSTKQHICSLKIISNVITLSRSDRSVFASDWDSDPFQLGTPGGIVNLRDGSIRPTTVEDNVTKLTSISPSNSECTLWISSLRRATDGSDEILDYIQRWCFYILTGDTRHECFLFTYGPGSSGKSTFIRVISEIMGDYSRAAQMNAFANSNNNEHSTEIAGLAGSRLVTATETEEGISWNESRIKALTGRDRISARFMRKDFFEFSPKFKIVLAGNHKPQLKSVGEEMRRRIHLLDFPNTILENDRIQSMPERLQKEYPAILQWMINGRESWFAKGMEKPSSVNDAVEEYLEAEDTIGDWINECCKLHPDAHTRSSIAYQNYCCYSKKIGEIIIAQKRFTQRLENRGFEKTRNSGGQIFIGLMLK